MTQPWAECDRQVECLERIRRLQAVVDTSLLVNSTLDLRELADHIIATAARLIGAERGSLFLLDARAATLTSLVAQGLGLGEITVKLGDGIVGAVAASGQAVILNDPYHDERFDQRVDVLTGYRTRSLLTVPVRDRDGTLTAVLQLLNHAGDGFSSADVDFLGELAAPFAIALTTARLHLDLVAQARMKEELRMAAEIQRTLRPTTEAAVDGLDLETLVRPCLEVGGDYFDLIPSPDQSRWWLIMADVSGKGVAAGLIAANIQAFMWSRRAGSDPLTAVVAEANDLLYGLARGRKFATMVVVEWLPASRLVRWVSAGHLPLLLGRDDRIQAFEATGRPIGLLPLQSYTSEERVLTAGDRILLYTDGILEAGMGSARGEFGLERIAAAFAGPPGARAALDRLAATLADHLGDEAPDDDVTMLCAECG